MKKTHFLLLVLLIFGYILIQFFDVLGDKRTKKGQVLINEIEEYKEENGVYPNDSYQFNSFHGDKDGPYYKKESDDKYLVYFTIGFDDLLIYNSEKDVWEKKVGSIPN